MKKDNVKGNITTKYIEYKRKNNGTSALIYPTCTFLIHPQNAKKLYH